MFVHGSDRLMDIKTIKEIKSTNKKRKKSPWKLSWREIAAYQKELEEEGNIENPNRRGRKNLRKEQLGEEAEEFSTFFSRESGVGGVLPVSVYIFFFSFFWFFLHHFFLFIFFSLQ